MDDIVIYGPGGERFGPHRLEDFCDCVTVGELANAIALSLGLVREHTLVGTNGIALRVEAPPPESGRFVLFPLA